MQKQLRKISAEEMEALFTFTRQHYVEYYDLQAELADHFNAIEAQWETDPQQYPEYGWPDLWFTRVSLAPGFSQGDNKATNIGFSQSFISI